MITRRGLLGGFGALLAAPAIVRVASLMPVKSWPSGLVLCDGRMLPKRLYRELYAAIGEKYGGGDGYFRVPDYREGPGGSARWGPPGSSPLDAWIATASKPARPVGAIFVRTIT